ncbi:MAG: four helix bundle protein [Acidobacteria bacterium]|nr:four helix bundle protein [Acidobacteriota bacterium]
MGDILLEKSYIFALRIVELSEFLTREKKEYVLSRKVLDSGTNIGLFIEEGKQGEDRHDFIQKYSLANKEAFKSHFLLRLLRDSKFIDDPYAASMLEGCDELKRLLISSLKTARSKE